LIVSPLINNGVILLYILFLYITHISDITCDKMSYVSSIDNDQMLTYDAIRWEWREIVYILEHIITFIFMCTIILRLIT